jgi:hypothetical protein
MSQSCNYYYHGYSFEQRIVLEPLYAIAPAITTGYYAWMHDPTHVGCTDDDFFAVGEYELQILGAYANRLFETCEQVNAYMNNMSIEEYYANMQPGSRFKLEHMAFWMRYVRIGQRTGYFDHSVLKYCPIDKGWEEDYHFDPTYENMLLTYEFLVEKIRQFECLRDDRPTIA